MANGVPTQEEYTGETGLRTGSKQFYWEDTGDVNVYMNPQPYPPGLGWTRVKYDLAPGHNIRVDDEIMGGCFISFEMDNSADNRGVEVQENYTPARIQAVCRIGTQDNESAYAVLDFSRGPASNLIQTYSGVFVDPTTRLTYASVVYLTFSFRVKVIRPNGGLWLSVDYHSTTEQVAKIVPLVLLAFSRSIDVPSWEQYPGEAVSEVALEWDVGLVPGYGYEIPD